MTRHPDHWRPGRWPERMYVLTGGQARTGADFDLVTEITTSGPLLPVQAAPEVDLILRLCRTPTTVAEICGRLGLPFGVVSVLLDRLLASGQVTASASRPASTAHLDAPDIALIEEVLRGLKQLA